MANCLDMHWMVTRPPAATVDALLGGQELHLKVYI